MFVSTINCSPYTGILECLLVLLLHIKRTEFDLSTKVGSEFLNFSVDSSISRETLAYKLQKMKIYGQNTHCINFCMLLRSEKKSLKLKNFRTRLVLGDSVAQLHDLLETEAQPQKPN